MIANSIEKQRLKKNISQKDLGQAARVTRSVISMAETGRYVLDMDALMRIAAVLGVRPEDLYPPEVLRIVYGIGAGTQKAARAPKQTINVRIPAQLAQTLDALAAADGIGSRDEAARFVIRLGILAYMGKYIYAGKRIKGGEVSNEKSDEHRADRGAGADGGGGHDDMDG